MKLLKEIIPPLDYDDEPLRNTIIETLINQSWFKQLNLSNEEIDEQLLTLLNIKRKEDECNRSKLFCPLENRLHIKLERTAINNIELNSYSCYKPQKITTEILMRKYLIRDFSDKFLTISLTREFFADKLTKTKAEVLSKFNQIIKNQEKKGVYLYGNFGVGKTYMLAAIANSLIAHFDYKIAFISVAAFVNKLKNSIFNPQLIKRTNNLINEAEAIFFDDLGNEKITEWFYHDYFLSWLDNLIVSNKTVFFSSFFSLNDFKKALEDNTSQNLANQNKNNRIIDRIKNLTQNQIYNVTDINLNLKK